MASAVEIPQAVRESIGIAKVRRVTVTAREIRRFAQAIGAKEPKDYGERGLLAPPLFFQTLAYADAAPEDLPRDGSPIELDVPIPAEKTVGGGSEFEIMIRAEAGDSIDVVTQLKDVYTKRGRSGLLYFVVVETEFRDLSGATMARETATYIKRP